MRRTWGMSLAVWLPLVVVLELLSLLPWIEPARRLIADAGPWVQWPLSVPWLVVFGVLTILGGPTAPAIVVAFAHWPIGLAPLLGWLRTRRWSWLVWQAVVILLYAGLAIHFMREFHRTI